MWIVGAILGRGRNIRNHHRQPVERMTDTDVYHDPC